MNNENMGGAMEAKVDAWITEAIRLFGAMRTAMHWPDLENHLKQMETDGMNIRAALSDAREEIVELRDMAIALAVRDATIHSCHPQGRMAEVQRAMNSDVLKDIIARVQA